MKKYLLGFILFSLVCGVFLRSSWAKPAPGVSGVLSIVPGLGQVANGDTLDGFTYFVSTIGLMATQNRYGQQVGVDLWMYNMYDAFRDAGAKDTAKHNIVQNWIAPFNPLNIIDPIGASVLTLYAVSPGGKNSIAGPKNRLFTLPFFTAVSAGEEGLFRGFLYPGFSSLTGSHWIGAAISSVLFSVAHLVNRTAYDRTSGALGGRFIIGMLLCWQLSNNNYDMRKGIFTHAWIDTIVDWKGGGSAATGAVAPGGRQEAWFLIPPTKVNYQIRF